MSGQIMIQIIFHSNNVTAGIFFSRDIKNIATIFLRDEISHDF